MGNALNNTNLGGFPKEYNPRIHGAYQADRYYGTRTYLIDGVHRIYTIPVFVNIELHVHVFANFYQVSTCNIALPVYTKLI